MSYIAEALRPLAVPIHSVQIDPSNARLHSDKNIAAIRGSLRSFGQRKPIVVNRRTGLIEAGNGTWQAALAEGWTHIAAIFVDDDPAAAAGFSLADNRSAELARWDTQALDALLRTALVGDSDLQEMLDQLAQEHGIVPAAEPDPPARVSLPPEYKILVECRDEAHQAELLERFSREGLSVKAVII